MRSIKIVTTQGVSGTIETNVTTLGNLKPLLNQRNIDYSGMKMLVGETKNELSQDAAILPEGDFKLYLVPVKTKSGVDLDDMARKINSILSKVELIEIKLSNCNNITKSTANSDDLRDIEEARKLANDDWD